MSLAVPLRRASTSSERRESIWRRLAPLAFVGALGAVLRFATLGEQSFWRDEAATAVHLDQGLTSVLADVAAREATPPLYFVVAWLWSQAFGLGEVGLRSLSAVLGTGTIAVAYALGARLAGPRAGLVAAGLVAANPFLIWFSQEARAYALLIALAALASLVWVRVLETRSARAAVGWGVIAALCLWTHYHAVFLLAPQGLVLAWVLRHSPARAAAALGIPAAAGAALLPLLLDQRDGRTAWLTETSLVSRILDVPKHWIAGPFGSPVDVLSALAAGIVALGLLRALGGRPGQALDRRRELAMVAIAAVSVPGLLALGGADYVLDRYLSAALVPVLCLAAAGLAELRRLGLPLATAAIALMLTFTVVHATEDDYARENWRSAARYITDLAGPVVIVVPAEDASALGAYLGDAPPLTATARARTIVSVAPWRFGGARPEVPPAPPGTTPVERIDHPTTTMVTYRAAAGPVEVGPPATLHPLGLRTDRAMAVLVHPGRATP